MIEPDTFYKQTNENFRQVFNKMDTLHKETRDEIKEIREKISDVDGKITNHVSIVKAIEDKENQAKKRNYFITGLVVTVSFGLWKVFEFIFS